MYTSSDAARHQDDATLTFPVSCNAFIPECSPFYLDQPRELICEGGAWSELL